MQYPFFSTLLITIPVAAHTADKINEPRQWENDCVGRLSLSTPSIADFSAHPLATILSNMLIGEAQPETYFIDGQKDGYAFFNIPGHTLIGHPASAAEIKAIRERMRLSRNNALMRHKKKRLDTNGRGSNFSFIETIDKNETIGWQVNGHYNAVSFAGSTPIHWTGEYNESQKNHATQQQDPLTQISNAESRNFGNIPIKNGLCLPYIFIPIEKYQRHHIAISYRLRSHPDVTILLQDSYASNIEGSRDGRFRKPSAEYDNEFFWTLAYQSPKKYRSLWHWPHLRNVKLAGIHGKSSFMELTREGDTIDYGYFASARTDETQKTNWTNVQIFVIRNAENAISKGLQPINKDEFLKIAETIAASVKIRRPTPP